MQRPSFYYDVSSPYAYLAACRVDEVLPVRPQWRPIAFGVIVRRLGKVPWSFGEHRDDDFAVIAERASGRGLPEVRYPEGWPAETYSLTPIRAALLASDEEQLRAVSHQLFRMMFVEGRHLANVETVIEAAVRAGMDPERVREGVDSPEVKQELRERTAEAVAKGVTGVPTVIIGDKLYWGDDRLEEAAGAYPAV